MSEERHELEGVKRRERRRGIPWLSAGFFLLVCFGIVVALVYPRQVVRNLKEIMGTDRPPVSGTGEASRTGQGTRPAPVPAPVPPPEVREPDPPPVPAVVRPPDGTDLRKLANGIDFKVKLTTEEGELASLERKDRESYVAEYELRVRLPRASVTMKELSKVSAYLGELIPGLPALVAEAEVSPWFEKLYANKVARVRRNVTRLDDLLSRHNFYDCETMLNLRDGATGRRVFLLQGDMDVVSDGSDGDRLPVMPEEIVNSTHYQPFTSYRWKKRSDTPNPMLAGWKRRIENARRELKEPGTGAGRKKWLRERIADLLEPGIADMESNSFLIAEYDPFVVIPIHMVLDRQDPYAPNIGDYVVVIRGRELYPAIVGDAGPSFKTGEASLRLAKEIDPNANPYRRPVSDLTVTYLVFPRSADTPRRPPDYAHWRQRCLKLLGEIGGLGQHAELHQWEDLLAKEDEPETATATAAKEEEKEGTDEP